MRIQPFIVSYSGDIEWLGYCLKTIHKFCQGFMPPRVLVPAQEAQLFEGMLGFAEFDYYDRHTPQPLWHIQHQCEKLHADIWCPQAEIILHTDSDCIFTAPVSPADYLVLDKPVLLIEEYARLKQDNWKPTVDRALGIDAKYETMRRHPALHWRGIYSDCRKRIEEVHQKSAEEYILSVKPSFPWGISEFNTIGAFAVWDPRWRERYHFIDVGKEPHPESSRKLMQFWSHRPPNQPQSTPWGTECVPLTLINQALNANP